MLPVTVGHYKSLTKKGTLIVAKNTLGQVVGTAAYTQFYTKNIWEFGGWAVLEEYQHQGVGLKLMTQLFKKHHHFQTIAFGNKNSGPILESLGAKIIKNHAILPKRAFELCATCPRKPKIGCCDIIYNLSPVVEALGMPDTSWMSPRQFERLVYGIGEGQSGDFMGLGKKPEEWC
ncbi:MAG TPA: GNAT family N-acetyltransferase [Patescibacteria group bacterium]|nr:GNAT family N-acetyltransferase [Patescibacteria group bacterium]